MPRFIEVHRAAWPAALLVAALLVSSALATEDRQFALGDTLSLIQRPLLNIPAIASPGDTLRVECSAAPETDGWSITLRFGGLDLPLPLIAASYDGDSEWWTLSAELPAPPLYELYDLRVAADGGLDDLSENSVRLIPAFREDFYFVHVTDTHLPDHRYSSNGGQPADSTEMDDLREVIRDINLMNPEFVLLTGDLVNEGELEDYQEWRSFSRAQRLLAELEVPVFLTAGNHDVGGWDATPPPDGSARRNWWRFFGWPRLDDPPTGAPWYTQNYSFDYGLLHFAGLEAYVNYDDWRWAVYGGYSFTDGQIQWLQDDLAASDRPVKVLFHHNDFSDQLDLAALDVDLSLYGHIHRDDGGIQSPPFDLATNNCCDGERSYRVIRATGSTLMPQATVSAGSDGNRMRLQFNPANDGSHDTVSALVSNEHLIPFEYALIKFRMPKHGIDPQVSAGSIVQVDDAQPGWTTYYVELELPAYSWDTLTFTVDTTDAPGDAAPHPVAELLQNHPNPFNPRTTVPFHLDRAQRLRLAVYDLHGREQALLAAGRHGKGWHRVDWDGRDQEGRGLPSGVYLCRLETETARLTRKLLLLR